jgi:hypothetical protein
VRKREVLGRIADAVIRRVLHDTPEGTSIDEALRAAYPFGGDPAGAEIWNEALDRNAQTILKHLRDVKGR